MAAVPVIFCGTSGRAGGRAAVPLAQQCDRPVLPGEFAGQCIYLGLPLGGDGREIGAILFEKRARIGRPAAPIHPALRFQAGDQRRHASRDPPLDKIELVLCLSACLFHAEEQHLTIN
mgnify:CR=1 FL=1